MRKVRFILAALLLLVGGVFAIAQGGDVVADDTVIPVWSQLVTWILSGGGLALLATFFPKIWKGVQGNSGVLQLATDASIDLGIVAKEAAEVATAVGEYTSKLNQFLVDGTLTDEEKAVLKAQGDKIQEEIKDVPIAINMLVSKLKEAGQQLGQ